jgi:hypothetical protein
MERFPVILLDVDSKPLPYNAIARSNSFFIRAVQRFDISLPDGDTSNNLLYSVKLKDTPTGSDVDGMFDISTGKSFTGMVNFNYTLYIEQDTVLTYVGIDGIVRTTSITYKPDNVLDEQQENIYDNLLANNHLPSLDELEKGYIGTNKEDMLRRLLLDFKTIMRDKGKKSGIEKFLELIGFDPTSIVVTPEFKTPTGSLTTNPNTLTDVRTGNYHLLFDNWDTDPQNMYDENNMPLRILTITDLDDFFQKLFYALTLANLYFTLPEQDINFFGVVDSANNANFLSTAAVAHLTYMNNVYQWRSQIGIDIFEKFLFDGPRSWLVYDTVQRSTRLDKSSVMTYGSSPDLIDEIYSVPQQFYSDQDFTPDLDPTLLEEVFANIFHLQVSGPIGFYWTYEIVNADNPLIKLQPVNKFIFDNPSDDGLGHNEVVVVTCMNGTYNIIVTVWDLWNNKDEWSYQYIINDVSTRLEIEAFDSTQVANDIENLPGTLHVEIAASEGNPDAASSGVIIIRKADDTVAAELLLSSVGDTGIVDFPTIDAPFTLWCSGNQAQSFQMKVNGTPFDIPAFDNPTPAPMVYSNDDGNELVLNDGSELTTNDPLSFALNNDFTVGSFGDLSKNVYLQIWFAGQPEPLYKSLPDDSSPTRDNTVLGDIDLDADSPWTVTPPTDNYQLPNDLVPDDLSQYYNQDISGLHNLLYSLMNKRYTASSINSNFGIDISTQTIPTDFMDLWIDVLAIKFIEGSSLKIRKIDELSLVPVLFDYFNAEAYGSIPDKLFITAMDIAEDHANPDTITSWIFVTTMEAGIDLSAYLFDLVMVPDNFAGDPMSLQSVYAMAEGDIQHGRLPVNYDFPLFFRPSTLQPDFINYPPITDGLTFDQLPKIRSIWPRLFRVGTSTMGGSQVLALGDVFTCRFDSRYVSNLKDIVWTVLNSFTGETIFSTEDYMLKYRVNENTVYDVVLAFSAGVNGNFENYTIEKKSLFSSFTFQLDAAAL